MFSPVPRCQGLWGSQKYTTMFVSVEKRTWSAISLPWSQVRVRRSSAGIFETCRVRAARTSSAVRPWGRWSRTTYRLARSTRTPIADRPPLPMIRSPSQSRDRAVLYLWRSLADQNRIPNASGAGLLGPHVRSTLRSSRPETGRELLPQRSAGLNEERLVDRLVGNAHTQVIRIVTDQPGGDLLRRQLRAETPLDFTAQSRVESQLRRLGSAAALDCVSVGAPRSITTARSAP